MLHQLAALYIQHIRVQDNYYFPHFSLILVSVLTQLTFVFENQFFCLPPNLRTPVYGKLLLLIPREASANYQISNDTCKYNLFFERASCHFSTKLQGANN